MATINSTIISGAGAISALKPVLAGKKSILLVTDANVGKLEATKRIQHLLGGNTVDVRIVDSVLASLPMWNRSQTWERMRPSSVVLLGAAAAPASACASRTARRAWMSA